MLDTISSQYRNLTKCVRDIIELSLPFRMDSMMEIEDGERIYDFDGIDKRGILFNSKTNQRFKHYNDYDYQLLFDIVEEIENNHLVNEDTPSEEDIFNQKYFRDDDDYLKLVKAYDVNDSYYPFYNHRKYDYYLLNTKSNEILYKAIKDKDFKERVEVKLYQPISEEKFKNIFEQITKNILNNENKD